MRKSLEELRIANKLTQLQVACQLGVDQTAVSKWESGEALPRAKRLFDIAALYGVKVDDIDLYNNRRADVPEKSLLKSEP